ncbi:MAG: hypothetical protein FWD71_20810 [Oscillospiraceae bacterium]|nr:hypothetical protein [Oscillospiraceae bacterium]
MNQVSTKSENKNQQNSEAINISNNKYINKKNNNYNTAHTREVTGGEKNEDDNKKNKRFIKQTENHTDNTDNNFNGIINRFTQNEKVRTALWAYLNMRLKRPKTATTDYILELALSRLNELSDDPDTQIKILNQSILNSYPDLYELKNTGKGNGNNDYIGNNGKRRGDDGAYNTGLAAGETGANKFRELPGVVRLG